MKKGAKESDIDRFLQLIDQRKFIGFRDACAINLMYKSGNSASHWGSLESAILTLKICAYILIVQF